MSNEDAEAAERKRVRYEMGLDPEAKVEHCVACWRHHSTALSCAEVDKEEARLDASAVVAALSEADLRHAMVRLINGGHASAALVKLLAGRRIDV